MSMFPHTVTLYQTETVLDDKLNETTVNHITVLKGVLLIESKAANVRAAGLEGADAVKLHIPFSVKAMDGLTGEPQTWLPPKAYAAEADKSGSWTISVGTVFIKGHVIEPDKSQEALELGFDDVYQASSVDRLDFGSFPHWEVGGN